MLKVMIRVKLKEVLHSRDLQQKELIEMLDEYRQEKAKVQGTDFKRVRPASMSELYHNQRLVINKELVEDIASVLGITDVNELIEFTAYEL